jgi:hypothetical protein
MVHPIGSQFEPSTGRVEEHMIFVPAHAEAEGAAAPAAGH